MLGAVAGGMYAARKGATTVEVLGLTVLGGLILTVIIALGKAPAKRFFASRFPRVAGFFGIGGLPTIQEVEGTAAARLPTVGDLQRWQAFVERYQPGVEPPLGRLSLMYAPEYAEMEPFLAESTRQQIEHTRGMDLTAAAAIVGDPVQEIKRLIFRDLMVVQRKVFRADPYSDDNGYLQLPPRSS